MPKPTKPPATTKADQRKARKPHPPIRFTATLASPQASDDKRATWTFIALPKQASDQLPARGMVSIDGFINGHAFQATLEPDGRGGHWLKVDKKLREAAQARVGGTVTLEVSPVAQEPEPQVPPDLRKALAAAAPKAREAWLDITPLARRDWVQWITSGKRAETRAIRIDKACDMLAKGKRRPCCFDRSGMYDKSLSCPVAEERPQSNGD